MSTRQPFCTVFRDPGGDNIVRISETTRCTDGSILVVPAGTLAYFVFNGEVSEPYGPGRYELHPGVSPFFLRLRNFMTGGDPGITVNLFYVATDMESHMRLGTGAFYFEEKRFHQTIGLSAPFDIDFRVADAGSFLKKIVGMHSGIFHIEDINPKIEAIIVGTMVEELSRRFDRTDNISSLNNSISAISGAIANSASSKFAQYGLELISLHIKRINVNEEDLKRIQELEKAEAEGRMKTNLEKYNLAQIYGGDVAARTRAEILTGMPRGPYPPAAGSQAGATMGNIAATLYFLKSLPEDALHPFSEYFSGNAPAAAGNTANETNDATDNNGSRLPPIRRP